MTHSPGRLCVGPEPALEETDAELEPPYQQLSALPVFLVLYSGFNIHTLVRERCGEGCQASLCRGPKPGAGREDWGPF